MDKDERLIDRIYYRLGESFGQKSIISKADQQVRELLKDQASLIQLIQGCDVMLVLIDDDWLTQTDAQGVRLLDVPSDDVRAEVRVGLMIEHVTVIPVLLGKAQPPALDQLPDAIKGLNFNDVQTVRDEPYTYYDLNRLTQGLQDRFGSFNPVVIPPPKRSVESGMAFNVQTAIRGYREAFSSRNWDLANTMLMQIRASGIVPKRFDLEQAEQDVRREIELEKAEHDYTRLRLMAQNADPERVWQALQEFWKRYPGYDPDGLEARFRP